MKPLTREWVEKAEADFQSASRELRRRNSPNLDLACFCAQQGIEKYLKARLQEASIPFGRTHDLEALANQLGGSEPALILLMPVLRALSAYAVVFRYPGRSATKAEAKAVLNVASQVREIVRKSQGLPSTTARRLRKTSAVKTRKKSQRRRIRR